LPTSICPAKAGLFQCSEGVTVGSALRAAESSATKPRSGNNMARKKQTYVKGSFTHRRTEGDYMGVLLEAVPLADWPEVVRASVAAAKDRRMPRLALGWHNASLASPA
jgi:hypothetical protein